MEKAASHGSTCVSINLKHDVRHSMGWPMLHLIEFLGVHHSELVNDGRADSCLSRSVPHLNYVYRTSLFIVSSQMGDIAHGR